MNKKHWKRYLLTENGRIFDTKSNLIEPYYSKNKNDWFIAVFVPRLGKFIEERIVKEANSMIELSL